MVRIVAGDSLPSVAKALIQLLQLSHDYNQNVMSHHARFLHQVCLNLQGKAADPLKFTGELVDEDQIYEEAMRGKQMLLVTTFLHFKHMIAFYADDFEFA